MNSAQIFGGYCQSKPLESARKKVQAVRAGMGLEAYRKISAWYNAVSQATVHDMRCKVMNPTPAKIRGGGRQDRVESQCHQATNDGNSRYRAAGFLPGGFVERYFGG